MVAAEAMKRRNVFPSSVRACLWWTFRDIGCGGMRQLFLPGRELGKLAGRQHGSGGPAKGSFKIAGAISLISGKSIEK